LGHFHELLPTVLGFQGDLQGPWHSLHVWEACPKTRRFCVYGHFRELLPTVLGFRGDLQGQWHSVHVWEAWPKLVIFAFLAVSWAIAHSLWFPGWFTRPMTLSTCLGGMIKNSSFLHLWTFSWAIAHYFGVLGRFRRNMTICTCLRGMTKNLSFLRFRSVFVSYCP
jgi:hypothetical protein